MAYIFDLSDAWTGGAAFTAIKMNVTDGGSTAGSLLMDLQVGGSSRFSVSKNGLANVPNTGTNGTTGYAIANVNVLTQLAGNTAILDMANGVIFAPTGTTSSNSANYRFGTLANGGATLAATLPFGWSAGLGMDTKDTIILRDAANTLAQRNGVNAQAFNLYNTYTDASNYERGFMRFVSNVLEIGPEAAGTGTVRDFRLGNVNNRVTFNGAGNLVTFQVGAGSSTQLAIRNTNKVGLNQGGLLGWSNSASSADPNLMAALFNYVASGVIGVRGSSATDGGSLEFLEQTAPAAPATDRVRIYAEDDGAGKTRLMARFATGAAVQIAIEP